jgi:O-Antigen ligase
MSRAFAYLGFPAWQIFVGEVVLALLLLSGPKMGQVRWLRISLKLASLRPFRFWYGLFFVYGVIQVVHGIWTDNPPLLALRDLAFNYYPLYFLLGVWAGIERPDLLLRVLRSFAWFNGIYGTLFILYLNRTGWFVSGVSEDVAPVPVFGQPIYSFVALLALLAGEKEIRRSWHLLVLNSFVMLGMQIRSEWLALAVGVVTWYMLTRQGKRVLQAGAIVVCLLGVMYLTDFSLPSPEGRAEVDISARQLVGRGLAPFRADLSDEAAAAGLWTVESQEATFMWRTFWWFAIWDSVHEAPSTLLWGHGYGFALGDLVPYLRGEFIRTPHNEFFYALGYTGWVGVILFSLFQLGLLRLLWQATRISGNPFGVIYWAAMMTFGMFFPLGETPYGAIPFYLIIGWVAAQPIFGKEPALAPSTSGRLPHLPAGNGDHPELARP